MKFNLQFNPVNLISKLLRLYAGLKKSLGNIITDSVVRLTDLKQIQFETNSIK